MEWIAANKEWVFSGIGVFLIGAFMALMTRLWRPKTENHPDIAIHTQYMGIVARDSHEEYDDALAIFIENIGNSPIHIRRALFLNQLSFLPFLRKKSKLPVYAKAFKDAEQNAYELKFGDQWFDPQTDISPRDRVMTYLPLSSKIPDHECNCGQHGEVILRYSSDGVAGTHKVRV